MAGSASRESENSRLTPEDFLDKVWREMRNDGRPFILAGAIGAVEALLQVGMLSQVEADGWLARFERCPGHDDEGGRVWCAYCGRIKRTQKNEETDASTNHD